ncbi:hypothetical protein RND71_019017 [Anisodus tanguticus]|uniref:Protein kinase domain-containing protein n=1 Tax=Anisodus tanguticus TaxID=243964 RepID=A0AAE1VHE3_9SOLA|nr:hypothetical protein RND71_019017 [Anisodus tanguticus]
MTTEFLLCEEYHQLVRIARERLSSGQSWSGLFPCKKRSGQIFIAMMSKSPLYEDGELFGIVTVSNDAASFININSKEDTSSTQEDNDHQPGALGINFKRIQWNQRPQIASSVSNLASKVFSLKRGEDACDASADGNQKGISCDPGRTWDRTTGHGVVEGSGGGGSSSRNSNEFSEALEVHEQIPGTFMNNEELKAQFENSKSSGAEDSSQQLSEHYQSPKSGGSIDSHGNSSNKIENESSFIVNCEILWEDINLKEEIGRGSYGVVYLGIWNGSFSQNFLRMLLLRFTLRINALLDYKKEVEIMKRLRHPNVLLFTGAVFSQEKPAIVTEFLPRGSLFKTLHGNIQALDFRRHLRMTLNARGMNYLHRRNPPIVHRDLKSSNLLVDNSWTVKSQWMAPEVLRNEPSTEKSDVFSFGVILWELITESIPWSNLNSVQIVGVVGYMDRRLEIPENLDTRVSAIILDCWQRHISNRRPRHSLAGDGLEIAYYSRDWIRAERRRCGQPEINEEDDENYNEILTESSGSDVDQFDQQIPIPTEEPQEIIKQLEQVFLRM